jgi:hypothetical protein
MRYLLVAAVLTMALPSPGNAQMVPAPAASAAAGVPSACEPRQANLGGVGRASVVAFTGAIFGDRVCATVANLSLDGIAPAIADAPAVGALAVAPLGNGAGATLVISSYTLAVVPADAAPAVGNLTPPASNTTAPVGPFVISPGGQIPNFGGDTKAEPRVVLAYAGPRLLLIGTSAVTLVDLARALRDQPDLFGADAVERAVVLASGAQASLLLRTADGTLGTQAPAARYLILGKR